MTKKKESTISTSKYKYFEVSTTTVVRANSKTDALARVAGNRKVDAFILSEETNTERISAAEAHSVTV